MFLSIQQNFKFINRQKNMSVSKYTSNKERQKEWWHQSISKQSFEKITLVTWFRTIYMTLASTQSRVILLLCEGRTLTLRRESEGNTEKIKWGKKLLKKQMKILRTVCLTSKTVPTNDIRRGSVRGGIHKSGPPVWRWKMHVT